MSEQEFGNLELALIRVGRARAYPPPPPLAPRVRAQIERERVKPSRWNFAPRPALTLTFALLVALALLLAIPQTREAIGQILGLRTIRIFFVTPTPTPFSAPTDTPEASLPFVPVTATPNAQLVLPPPATQCCATTLADARTRAKFALLIPPEDAPAQVYFQDLPGFGPGAQQVILVFEGIQSRRVVLYEASQLLYQKLVGGGTKIAETTVHDQRALWMTGEPHVLITLDANGQPHFDTERSVLANTLVWESDDVTFRLETSLNLSDALSFAESLRGPPRAGFVQCCVTTLADASSRARFKILLPANQTPSRVHFQELADFGGAQQVILLFGDPRVPAFTLYEAQNFVYGKVLSAFAKGVGQGTVLNEANVNGLRALWFSGAPHLLVYLDTYGQPILTTERAVNANTLAWETDELTFRLETKASLDDAVKFAGSLK